MSDLAKLRARAQRVKCRDCRAPVGRPCIGRHGDPLHTSPGHAHRLLDADRLPPAQPTLEETRDDEPAAGTDEPTEAPDVRTPPGPPAGYEDVGYLHAGDEPEWQAAADYRAGD